MSKVINLKIGDKITLHHANESLIFEVISKYENGRIGLKIKNFTCIERFDPDAIVFLHN